MPRWGCAGRSYPSHSNLEMSSDMMGERGAWREQVCANPTSSGIHWSQIGMGLLCAQNILSQLQQIRMRNARPGARSHVNLSTGRPLPAYSRRLVARW